MQIIYFILDKILKLLTYYTPLYRHIKHRAASLQQQSYLFHTPLLSTPGAPLKILPSRLLYGKTRMAGLPDGEKN